MCPGIQATHQVLHSKNQQSFHLESRGSESLRVAGFPFCTWLTDELLQPVSIAFFRLDTPYISLFYEQVVEKNLLLERLDISGCTSLTDTLLLRVTTLSYRNASWSLISPISLIITQISLKCDQIQVSVCLTRLTHLTLSHCSWVSGASIEFLAFHYRWL